MCGGGVDVIQSVCVCGGGGGGGGGGWGGELMLFRV